jgi:methionyl-tRNA formyltransferase
MMGTGGFAVPTFRALVTSDHPVLALFTRPPKVARGRKSTPPPNPMREVAEAESIPVFMPESINSGESIRHLTELNPDLLVVCDYGQILSNEALGVAPLGGINLHGSLLPKYRGAAPINWALFHGESEVGVTVIHMTPKLDAGPCLALDSIPVQANDDAVTIEAKLSKLGVDTVQRSLELLTTWDRESSLGTIQDPSLATKAPRLKKQDGQIDWSRTAGQISNQIRAFKPWPGCFADWQRTEKNVIRLLIEEVNVIDVDADGPLSRREPGEIVRSDAEGIDVQCGSGVLRIAQLKPAGKRSLSADEFLRGYPLRLGARLRSD